MEYVLQRTLRGLHMYKNNNDLIIDIYYILLRFITITIIMVHLVIFFFTLNFRFHLLVPIKIRCGEI